MGPPSLCLTMAGLLKGNAMSNSKAIAPYTNGKGSYGLSADIRGANGAWHVWRNTQGRIICNGPSEATRLLDCADLDSAITLIWQHGAKDVARALQAIKREGAAMFGAAVNV